MSVPRLTRSLPGGDAAIGSRQDETGPSGANPRAATLACRHLLTVSALLVAGLAGRVLINPMQAIVCSALLGAVALAARRGGFVGGTTLAFGIGGLGAIGLAPGLVLSLIDPTAPFLFAAEGLLISLRFSSETTLGMTSRPDEVETGHRGRWVWFRSLGASVRLRRWTGGEEAGLRTSRVDAPSRRLLEVAYEGVCQVDESGRIAYVNRRLLEMFKCRKEQVLGRKVELFVYPEDVSAFRDRLSRRRQGVSEQYEFRFRRLDGEPLWAIVSASPLNGRGGRYRGAVAMLTDFSERRRMEEQLRGHQSILRGFYDGTPMKMGVVELLDDGDLLVLSANRLMAQYNDLQVTEIEGRRVSELKVPLGKLRFLVEKFLESRRRSQAVRFDYLCKCSHGARWISATVNFLGLSDQARPRFLFVGEDVTDRKHAEEDYRGLFENASEGIYRTSRDGRLLTVNPALARIFGFNSPAQMIEEVDSFTDRCYLDPESRKAFLRRIRALGGVSGVQSRVRTRQGSEIWISESGRAVLDPSGSVRFYEGIVDDITLRKLAESEIQALNDQLRRRLDWMTALSRVDSAIAEGGDLPCLLDVVLCEASRQLGVEAARVLVEKDEGASFSVGSTIGLNSPGLTNARGGFDSAQLRRIVEDHQTVWADLDSLSEYPGASLVKSEGFTQLLMVPLVSRGRVQGVLEVFGRAHMDSSPEWREALETLAGQAALAIDNASLMKDLQRSHSELASAYDATIEGWARVLDLRDKETEGHSQRVTDMTVRLARSLGISEAELVHVRRGALLHDIGKMGIPDGILLKPGPLAPEEWTVMRRHPEYAYEMLSPIAFLRPALDIPLNHHERWDGTGYPKGLKGEAIPLTARIFAAVDIWDALSHDRPYRQAWSPEAVREHLASLSGSHLDPDVVRSFLALLSNQPVAPTATPPDWIAGGSRDECSCVPAPLPALETERLEALWEYQVLDSEPEPAFDEIAQLAASVCETPIALISLIDTHRQWFKARVGLTSEEICRDLSLCTHTMLLGDLLVVPDTRADPRFAGNPLVEADPRIRSYAGVPLLTPSGLPVGTLCVMDRIPRTLTPTQTKALRALAPLVVRELEARRADRERQGQVLQHRQLELALRDQKAAYDCLVRNIPQRVYRKDMDGCITFASERFCEWLGVRPEEVLGRTDYDFFPAPVADQYRDDDRRVLRLRQPVDAVEVHHRSSDQVSYVRCVEVPVLDETGATIGVQGMVVDVTDRFLAERSLRDAEARFRAFMEHSPCAAFIKNDDGSYNYINSCFEILFQIASSRILGKTDDEVFPSPEALRRQEADARVLEAGESVQLVESVECPDGLVREFLTRKFLFLDSSGQRMIGGVMLDVTPQKVVERTLTVQLGLAERLNAELASKSRRLEQVNALLMQQATTDSLTGLRNRRAFFEALEAALSERNRQPRPLSVLMLDVDNFKAYNDDFGHPAGDEVLCVVANLLMGHARAHDLPARYGGEEFVVLLPGASEEEAAVAACRLLEAIAQHLWPLRPVTASFGVASLSANERLDAQSLMGCADRALYHSKRNGRNRITHVNEVPPSDVAAARPVRVGT